MREKKAIRILDTTIRDGGYMFEHHFSAENIASIVSSLSAAGVPLIEVGHGMGLGVHEFTAESIRPRSYPQLRDGDHLQLAREVAGASQIGAIVTIGPRFVSLAYVDEVARLGYDFIRFVVMTTEVDSVYAYVERAKKQGLVVGVNVMQSYALSPHEIVEVALRSERAGADWFYLVDSAGGMTPKLVKQYVSELVAHTELEIGLHAHNNSGSAVLNCLGAVEAGATLVDGTVLGIGRATGNPPTEQLILGLQKAGLCQEYDVDQILGIGRATQSLFDPSANDPFDFISGSAMIHSRNVKQLVNAAKRFGCRQGAYLARAGSLAAQQGLLCSLSFEEEFLAAAAEETPRSAELVPSEELIASLSKVVRERWQDGTMLALEELVCRKHQHHKRSCLHLSRAATAVCTAPVPWETERLVGVTIPWDEQAIEFPAGRIPDALIVDSTEEMAPDIGLTAWRLSFELAQARALEDLLTLLVSRGATLWIDDETELRAFRESTGVLASTSRPDGPAIRVMAREAEVPTDLKTGDQVVVQGRLEPAQIDLLRRNGVTVLQPRWSHCVAGFADTLDRLGTELEGPEHVAGLTGPLHAAGSNQSVWDAERGVLLELGTELDSAAELIARARATALLLGTTKF